MDHRLAPLRKRTHLDDAEQGTDMECVNSSYWLLGHTVSVLLAKIMNRRHCDSACWSLGNAYIWRAAWCPPSFSMSLPPQDSLLSAPVSIKSRQAGREVC